MHLLNTRQIMIMPNILEAKAGEGQSSAGSSGQLTESSSSLSSIGDTSNGMHDGQLTLLGPR